MSEKIEEHIPLRVLNQFKGKSKEEIILLTKIRYLQQISVLRGGKDFLNYLFKIYEIKEKISEKLIKRLAQKLTLNEVYLYLGYQLSNQSTTYVYKVNLKGMKRIEENEFGQPIWRNETPNELTLWATKDSDKTFNLFFFSRGEKKRYFNPITQFVEYIIFEQVVFIIGHKDKNFVEFLCKNIGVRSISQIISFLQKKYGLRGFSPIIITENDIRMFDKKIQETTYEVREGTCSVALTRAQPGISTKQDPTRTYISAREFRKEHGVLNSSNGSRTVVGLTRGNPGKIQFKSSLTLEERKEVFDKLIQILGW